MQRRKKDPGKGSSALQTNYSSDEETEDDEYDQRDASEVKLSKGVNYEDNLTYHEDSLSVFRGYINVKNREMSVWITTDSGSMTQLIQEDYAKRLKIKRCSLPTAQWFHINGPGGGRDMVTAYVKLPVKIKVKRADNCQHFEESNSYEDTKTIELRFGVCSQLPVPILWGGVQMRKYNVVDYHKNRTLAMTLSDGIEYLVPSTSWMMALTQMKAIEKGGLRKIYSPFFPTAHQMSNMVRGERATYNLAAVLYPLLWPCLKAKT